MTKIIAVFEPQGRCRERQLPPSILLPHCSRRKKRVLLIDMDGQAKPSRNPAVSPSKRNGRCTERWKANIPYRYSSWKTVFSVVPSLPRFVGDRIRAYQRAGAGINTKRADCKIALKPVNSTISWLTVRPRWVCWHWTPSHRRISWLSRYRRSSSPCAEWQRLQMWSGLSRNVLNPNLNIGGIVITQFWQAQDAQQKCGGTNQRIVLRQGIQDRHPGQCIIGRSSDKRHEYLWV